jgi:hypothetical protein
VIGSFSQQYDLAGEGRALQQPIAGVTDPYGLSLPPHIASEQVTEFALSTSRIVLARVGRMIQMARSILRNITRL